MENTTQQQHYFKKQREAILNDDVRKQLFQRLFEVYANSLPMLVKKENGEVQCYYDESVEEIAKKIRDEITLRDNQIFNSFRA